MPTRIPSAHLSLFASSFDRLPLSPLQGHRAVGEPNSAAFGLFSITIKSADVYEAHGLEKEIGIFIVSYAET